MCGIAGVLQFRRSATRPSKDLVESMCELIAHRGPDDHDIWADEHVALGHQRLSIIDLSSNGRQPMSNEDGTIQITYNGEIYNFPDLRDGYQLDSRGHRFKSRTDTEVVVHLYEELGLDMLPELDGMFAFALWDQKNRLLHLARDRWGIKPLFYAIRDDRLLFGSEIKTILADAEFPRKVNLQALHDYLTFDYIPGEQTAFDGIFEVRPGHVLTVDVEGKAVQRSFFKPEYNVDSGLPEDSAAKSAIQLMEEAVERQLISDVPVGVFLSGGMDSSALTALMAGQRTDRVRTFSIGFEERSFDELSYAKIVAEEFNTIHREILVTAERVREMLPDYLSFIDEPYADGSAIPTYYVSRLAREDVKVVLSGEGGDEVFAGYDTHAAYKASRWFRRVPGFVRNGIISPLVNLLPVSHKKLSLEFKLKRFLGGQDLDIAEAHMWWRIVLSEKQKRAIYSDQVLKNFDPALSKRFFEKIYSASAAAADLNRILEIDSRVFLPDDLMIKNDRMSMAHSLEARVPFTDNQLTGFMETVPPSLKIKGLNKKYLMKRALRGRLPEKILNKKKVGLEMPYSKWIRHELRDLVSEYFSEQKLADTGLFDPRGIHAIIDEHLEEKFDHGRAIWGLLNFMMWHEMYIGGAEIAYTPSDSGVINE